MPVTNLTKKTWLATKVRKADSFLTRLVGLLKRTNLGPEEALWLMPSKGIHTIGMKFPIDVLYVDKNYKVIRADPNMIPYRLGPFVSQSAYVVEMPVGTITNTATEAGDQLNFEY